MNEFRGRFRIFLAAFGLGLAFTSAYARVQSYIDAMNTDIPTITIEDVPVDLPVIKSDSPLIVRPQSDRFPLVGGGGGSGGGGYPTQRSTR